MSYTYANRKKAGNTVSESDAVQQPSLEALRSGAVQPTRAQMGHRVDLPDAMRAKMENAFGADLSAVKLYESQAVEDAGANAVAQGSNIAFAPGMLDFSSFKGQALLGHELSHVVSQARGEVKGSGFLNEHSLEARADREGAMAASGQQIAMPNAAMSTVTAAAAAGPMQADKNEEREAKYKQAQGDVASNILAYQQEARGRNNPKVLAAYKKAIQKASSQERKWGGKLSPDSTVDRDTGSMIFNALSTDPGVKDSDQLLHETDSALSLWGGQMNGDLMNKLDDMVSMRHAFHDDRMRTDEAYTTDKNNVFKFGAAVTDRTFHRSTTPQNTRFTFSDGTPATAKEFMDDFEQRGKNAKKSRKELDFLRRFRQTYLSNDNV